jgi:hypothetical protein
MTGASCSALSWLDAAAIGGPPKNAAYQARPPEGRYRQPALTSPLMPGAGYPRREGAARDAAAP